MSLRSLLPSIAIIACSGLSLEAAAQTELEWGGRIQSDIRGRIGERTTGEFYSERTLPEGLVRNENIYKFTLGAYGNRFQGVLDLDFVWLGMTPNVRTFADVSDRTKVEPFRIEAHSAYIEGTDVFIDGLDIRIGQQIVNWGVGDQFNPTNNLNADDLEDPLLFGTQQANLMAKLDYNFSDSFNISGVLVPIFRPALLPPSGDLALARLDRLPYVDEGLRHRVHVDQAVTDKGLLGDGSRYPTIVRNVNLLMPPTSFQNMQFAFRMATTIAEQDISFSYYQGRHDFPVPHANMTGQVTERQCNPADPNDCIDGLLTTDSDLIYPKMKVLGLNISGEKIVGYRLEAGLFFPQKMYIRMYQDDVTVAGVTTPFEYDYKLENNEKPVILDDTPFLKWVLGIDYTLTKNLYINAQWVHGLVDEFGAGDFLQEGHTVRSGGVLSADIINPLDCRGLDGEYARASECVKEVLRPRLGDYLVLGLDYKFMNGDGLLRLFVLTDVTPNFEDKYSRADKKRVRTTLSPFTADGLSMSIFPELTYNFGEGFELTAGALVQVGNEDSKFNEAAAGGHLIWTRARFSF